MCGRPPVLRNVYVLQTLHSCAPLPAPTFPQIPNPEHLFLSTCIVQHVRVCVCVIPQDNRFMRSESSHPTNGKQIKQNESSQSTVHLTLGARNRELQIQTLGIENRNSQTPPGRQTHDLKTRLPSPSRDALFLPGGPGLWGGERSKKSDFVIDLRLLRFEGLWLGLSTSEPSDLAYPNPGRGDVVWIIR